MTHVPFLGSLSGPLLDDVIRISKYFDLPTLESIRLAALFPMYALTPNELHKSLAGSSDVILIPHGVDRG